MYRECAKSRRLRKSIPRLLLAVVASIWLPACAQNAPAVPPAETAAAPAYTTEEIDQLVGPIALYPDDLLAIVLPASTYPLQIVQAQRFLEAAANDPSLKPDETWDDSVVALLNYPEVVKLLSDDLDWTAALGEAVLGQQGDVLAAIDGFRRRAHTAGNLRTDQRQVVAVDPEAVYIRPADPKVIYVPYYEPARVTVYQRAPAYYYYPQAYPVYYYPYPVGYAFSTGSFWGVTNFFSLGWNTRHLHVYDYGYYAHPYYSRRNAYHHDHYYYRRPTTVVNNYYVDRDGSRRPDDRDDRNRGDYDQRDYDRSDDYDRDRSDGRDRDGARHSANRADTYWRPDYRRTGARPGTDPRRASRSERNRNAGEDAPPAAQQPGTDTSPVVSAPTPDDSQPSTAPAPPPAGTDGASQAGSTRPNRGERPSDQPRTRPERRSPAGQDPQERQNQQAAQTEAQSRWRQQQARQQGQAPGPQSGEQQSASPQEAGQQEARQQQARQQQWSRAQEQLQQAQMRGRQDETHRAQPGGMQPGSQSGDPRGDSRGGTAIGPPGVSRSPLTATMIGTSTAATSPAAKPLL